MARRLLCGRVMAAERPWRRAGAMKQLNVFCEGPTEQGFCAQVLQPHLFPHGDGIIHTLAVGEKDHRHLYGLGRRIKYEKVRKFANSFSTRSSSARGRRSTFRRCLIFTLCPMTSLG